LRIRKIKSKNPVQKFGRNKKSTTFALPSKQSVRQGRESKGNNNNKNGRYGHSSLETSRKNNQDAGVRPGGSQPWHLTIFDRRRTAKVQTRSDKFFESLEATAQKLLGRVVDVKHR
jgi:hypothetical protein